MQKNILFGIGGLIAGLIIGFLAANSINRSAISQQNTAQMQTNAPFVNQQIQSSDIKEQQLQSKPLPEVSEKLDKAKNEPNNFDAQMEAGNLYLKIRAFDKAQEFYNRAEQLNPSSYEEIVQLGNGFFDVGKFEKAEKWYEQALAKKPDDINVRTDLGITFVEREKPDLDRAVKEFQTSLETNPRHEPTLYNLGIAYLKKGKFDETQQVLRQLEDVNPQGQLVERLKQILVNK
ncbi:MAG TPA: tetratricopeptide repeat protein [Pyrinomonadaceae bacterium]|nr:tetratricopeptide repeat protein [Pyrinomonadaceae bacterium]